MECAQTSATSRSSCTLSRGAGTLRQDHLTGPAFIADLFPYLVGIAQATAGAREGTAAKGGSTRKSMVVVTLLEPAQNCAALALCAALSSCSHRRRRHGCSRRANSRRACRAQYARDLPRILKKSGQSRLLAQET